MTATDMKGSDASSAMPRLASICAFAAIGLIAVATLAVLSATFDARLAAAASTLPEDAVRWGRFISLLGTSTYMFVLSGLLAAGPFLARRKLPDQGADAPLRMLAERSAYVFATLTVSGLTAQLIKHLVGRSRPTLFTAFGPYHFEFLSITNAQASFPSGHSTTAFAMAMALSLLAPRLRVALFSLAAAIATARIVVQAHYASDIAAGAVLGVASALVVARLFARRGVAFALRGERVALKHPGVIAAALARRQPAP